MEAKKGERGKWDRAGRGAGGGAGLEAYFTPKRGMAADILKTTRL